MENQATKIVGEHFYTIIFVSDSGEIIHQQTIIPFKNMVEVIKQWPQKTMAIKSVTN